LIREYTPDLDPIITLLAVTNPSSLFWAIEMWGYGFLGLGTWFAAGFFPSHGIEGAIKALFVANGVLSVLGALYTSIRVEWVLSTAGMISYAAWNVLYLVLAALFLIVMIKKRAQRIERV
jgi:hypothetical protein